MKRRKAFISVLYHLSLILLPLGCFFSAACSGNHSLRQQQLNDLQAQNQADTVFRSDSLQKILVDYFNRHGSANEKMLANYLLGRAYADMGEAPSALHSYLNAAECADTTKTDVDYHILNRIHSQISNVFQNQNMPYYAIEHLGLASKYALLEGDTLSFILYESQKANPYYSLQQYDSVMIIKEWAAPRFAEYGRKDMAARCLGSGVYALIQMDSLDKAKQYLDYYIKYSGYCDSCGNAKPGHEGLYYTIGQYYLSTHKVDSAEHYFRLLQKQGRGSNNLIGASEGLMRVYEKKACADSVAKYAKICYEENDTAYSQAIAKNLQQMQAMFNYARHQQLAERKAQEAARTRFIWLLSSSAFVFFILLLCGRLLNRRRVIRQQQNELKTLKEDRNRAETELHVMQGLKMEGSKQQDESEVDIKHSDEEKQAFHERAFKELVEEKKKQIARKDLRIIILETMLAIKPSYGQGQDVLMLPIVKQLKEQATVGKRPLTQSQWDLLCSSIDNQCPNFPIFINSSCNHLHVEERQLIYLTRAYFKTSQIACLLSISDSYVSKLKSRLLLKVFEIDHGGASLFERIVKNLC